MFIRLLLLFFLWLLLRRLWRSFIVAKAKGSSTRRPYPGPQQTSGNTDDLNDITQQEISEADFEELDDK